MPKPNKATLKEWQELRDKAEAALQDLHSQMSAHWDQCSAGWHESEAGEEFEEEMNAAGIAMDAASDLPNWV